MRYATLCAIAKNEESYILEWVEYHLCLGFEHIYLYDNGGAVPLSAVLREYAERGFVTVIEFPLQIEQQMAAYADCLVKFGTTAEWMAFIDIDEFIVPKICEDIRDILDKYRDFGGLGVHWRLFGSNGYRRRPGGSVIENYTTVVDFNNHIKTIVRPSAVAAVFTPHNFVYRPGKYCVNEDGIPVLSHHSYHTSRTVQLNHYYYKSFEEFQARIERGLATGNKDGIHRRGPEAFRHFAEQALSEGVHDSEIIRLYQAIVARSRLPGGLEEFHGDGNLSLEHFAKSIAGGIAGGDMDSAGTALKKCLRYHDLPVVWIIAAKFYLLTGEFQRCFDFISKIVREPDSPLREEGYQCLADCYRARGEADTADRLLRSLA